MFISQTIVGSKVAQIERLFIVANSYSIYTDGLIYDGVSKTYVNNQIGIRYLQATSYTSLANGKTRKIEFNYSDLGYYNSRLYFLSNQSGNTNCVVVARRDDGIAPTVFALSSFSEPLLDNAFITTQNGHVTLTIVVHSDNSSLLSVTSSMGDLISISGPIL